MKRLLLTASVVMFAVGAYVASPFVTAWFIREAVRNGDAAYLERAIDWPSVRETLKPTLSRIALDLPDPAITPNAKPGLWQRFKAYWGQGAVNRALDSYVTPEGLTQLFTARKMYRDYVSGQTDESKLTLGERVQKAWARVKRAEFTSPTTFEIDMADKFEESRIYLGKLEFTGLGWKLKELRVRLETQADGRKTTSSIQQFAGTSAVPVSSRSSHRFSGGFISPAEAGTLNEDHGAAVALAKDRNVNFWTRALAAAHLHPRGDR